LETFCAPHILTDPDIPEGRRKVWKLKIPPDPSFNAIYPTIAEKAKQSWGELERKLIKIFKKSDMPILDQFFAKVFAEYGVCTLAFLRTQMEACITNDPHFSGLQQIKDEQFKKKLRSMADQLHSAYYLRMHPNESWNKYRNVILDVFKSKKTNPSVTKREILLASKKHLDSPIPEAIYNSIMKELAYPSKGGKWIFKTGNGKDGK